MVRVKGVDGGGCCSILSCGVGSDLGLVSPITDTKFPLKFHLLYG